MCSLSCSGEGQNKRRRKRTVRGNGEKEGASGGRAKTLAETVTAGKKRHQTTRERWPNGTQSKRVQRKINALQD
jgi:hypothetical protein